MATLTAHTFSGGEKLNLKKVTEQLCKITLFIGCVHRLVFYNFLDYISIMYIVCSSINYCWNRKIFFCHHSYLKKKLQFSAMDNILESKSLPPFPRGGRCCKCDLFYGFPILLLYKL